MAPNEEPPRRMDPFMKYPMALGVIVVVVFSGGIFVSLWVVRFQAIIKR